MVQTTETVAAPFCFINGKKYALPEGRAEATLLQFLREVGLTGTKLGCGEGGCGACTIMVSSIEDGKIAHRAVNACLCPLYAVEGMAVVTVEGIGNPRDGLHPVQERLSKAHGSQCGFCTPGFVMSMYSLLRSKTEPPTEHEIEEALAGNLCRCTGYRPILDAFRVFAKADPSAYTEEAIEASQKEYANGHANGHVTNGHAANGDATNGHATNGHADGESSSNAQDSSPSSSSDLSSSLDGKRDKGLIGVNGPAVVKGQPPEVSRMDEKHAPNRATEKPVEESFSSPGVEWNINGKTRKPRNPNKGKVCPSTGRPCDCGAASDKGLGPDVKSGGEVATDSTSKLTSGGAAKHVHASVEPIFPPELKKLVPRDLTLPGPRATWHRPTTLQGLFELKAKYNDAKLVVGNTEVGIEMKFKSMAYPHLIGVTHIAELNRIEVLDEGLQFGASATLTRLMEMLALLIKDRPEEQTRTFKAMHEQLKYFAGPPIRNAASVSGNICTGSPISDLNPIYMAAGATFYVAGKDTPERAINARDFFLGYRKVDMKPHEVLVRVLVPFTSKLEYVKEFKQAHRRDDDIAIVNAGMHFKLANSEADGWVVSDAHIAYGGVAPKTIMAPKTQAALEGKPFTDATLQTALKAVAEDVNITPNAPGGMVEFRRSLAASFLFRFYAEVANMLEKDAPGYKAAENLPPEYESAVRKFVRPAPKGVQYFTKVEDGQVVGAPERHMAADLQVTGEAAYTDDVKLSPDFLHAALVVSSKPYARILSVDPTEALKMEGVKGYYDHEDIPGENEFGAIIKDEEIFATEQVTCIGQQIGILVAETEAQARLAAKAVKVEYEDMEGAVFSCEEAIAANSFIEGWGHRVDCGDVEKAFDSGECDHIIEGEVKMGGQEHFYLEPQGSVIIPLENDEMVVISSTQGPMHNQMIVAEALGIPAHKVVARTKRLGGGFGGKETRALPLTGAACIPAWKLRRPVRLIQDRDEDMHTSGHRHAFIGKYKVGFTKEGKVIALDLKLYNNAGNTLDLSHSVMDRALLHSDGCYKIPHVRAVGYICKTNTASNTAFRGFGGPQGMLVTEQWVDRIARMLKKAPEQIRELNFLKEGETTHFGQVMECSQIQTCWDLVHKRSDFDARLKAVQEYNAKSRYRKRGIALIPTKFGISFTAKFLNQAGSLVHVYTDGTVLVTHGGVEMGQGLHTKVAQIAATALGLPLSAIFIAETATDKVPNASSTAASASSDLYGAAVANACEQINARLAPYKEKLPKGSFREVVNAAYFDRVDLSAHGFYKTPDVTGFGGALPFNYFTFGASCSEVELDTLTGDFHLLRSDLCMDVGQSLNPAIDIGQVEGGFVQGMGWTCIEELVWGDEQHKWVKPGTLFTRGPGTYKIPTANDIPIDLRVTLLRDAPCHRTPQVHSSKAVGEPPFFLGASVFFALKEAVYSARKDAGYEGWFRMDSPATPERLRMACADTISAAFAPHDLMPKISC